MQLHHLPAAAIAVALAALAGSAPGARGEGVTAACAPRLVSAAYEARIAAVQAHGADVLGERLLRRPGGPTYAAAAGALPQLLYARTSGRRALTDTGVYYVPSAQPGGSQGAGSPTLHVADGSEILYGSVDGPRLSVRVGAGRELFGSCLRRLTHARLGSGYLPIVRTRYVDAAGGRYTQESFGGRLADGASAAFLRITSSNGRAVRIVTRGATLTTHRSLAAVWAPRESPRARAISDSAYATARAAAAAYWTRRLAAGAAIEVPERVIMDAERATLIQNLMLTWRYSIGNPYEEFSFPESLDGAQVMSEYGFDDVASAILRTSLTRRPEPYANWKRGGKLLAAATAYRLSGNAAALSAATPVLAGYVRALARETADASPLLARERYSSDIPDAVLGLHSQAVAWQGLQAIAATWLLAGRPALAAQATTAASRLHGALLGAVARSRQRLSDGSLFLPVRLLDGEPAYPLLPRSRDGSYWNLVAPYALASGLFDVPTKRAALRYLQRHGGRLLGLVRAGAFSLYGPGTRSAGIDQVYGLNVARFLADLDEPDELVLSLYGQLGGAMTPRTFVAGEAASISPIGRAYYRSMYLPPNSVANAAFLETLRATVLHELPGRGGLELAYATPRAWLAPGKRIAVHALPSSFGPVSFTLAARAQNVEATVDAPRIGRKALRLRLRLPGGRHIRSVRLAGRPIGTFDARRSTIDLTGRGSSLRLEVALAP
jgi:hypothetical protein